MANKKKSFSISDYSKYMCLISIVLVFGIFSIVIPNFIGASTGLSFRR